MNKSLIYSCISSPQERTFNLEKELRELTINFPYFQTAQLLLAKSLHTKEDYRFSKQLRIAALQTPDRKTLKRILEKKVKISESVAPSQPIWSNANEIVSLAAVKLNNITNVKEHEVNTPILHDKESETRPEIPQADSLENEYIIKGENSVFTFSEWLQLHKETKGLKKPSFSEEPSRKKQDKSELIEKFIQTEPRISKPTKATFFSPQVMAKKSIEENDEIVSETLAKIYADQGDTQRAIRVYKKLGLLNPEKSVYFAALIKKLENTELT
jgi:hypothetical protein